MEDIKMKNIFRYISAATLAVLVLASCSRFLDRPSEDRYTSAAYYRNDAQVEQSVNFLYNSPWYDVVPFLICDSETMCGNVYQGGSAFSTLTVSGNDPDVKKMANALWEVNAQCNTVINNILKSKGNAGQAARNKAIGEALAWKAMAYFMLVRTFGDVPIIHDNTSIIKKVTYNFQQKVMKADVYEYIIMTLEKAMELLPKETGIGMYNRIDFYAAEALLSKVYLTRAGVSGTLNYDDLTKAKEYALDVILNSGRSLTPRYADIFSLKPETFQATGENLFSWLWTASSGIPTAQNPLQSLVGPQGIDEFGGNDGDMTGPSVDLQDAFGVSAADEPAQRVDRDDRRQATIMMFGDLYPRFWQDKGGLDMYRFYFDDSYCPSGLWANGSRRQWCSPSGAMYAKHLYGCGYDHVAALGMNAGRTCSQLPTHILRLADIYLVYAEACVLTGEYGNALRYVNMVRSRANAAPLETVTFQDVWKERRLELALEGDRWFDFVRRSYYDVGPCIAELISQRRSGWDSLSGAYKYYVTDDSGRYAGPGAHQWDYAAMVYNAGGELGSVNSSMFTIPLPTEDVSINPSVHPDSEAFHVDVRSTFIYDF